MELDKVDLSLLLRMCSLATTQGTKAARQLIAVEDKLQSQLDALEEKSE